MKPTVTLKTRREFLRTTVLGGAVSWTVPTFLAHTFAALQAEAAGRNVTTGKDGTILVVVQMAGGNDGLNTIVPFTNDHYHKARPRVGLKEKDVLRINDELGFHPALGAFKALYDEGCLSVIQGIGYPNPNRSHFRSTEIWHTASDSNKFKKYGWIGRYFDNACQGADPAVGVSVGRQMPQAFAARRPTGVSLENPQSYRYVNPDRPEPGEQDTGEATFRMLNDAEVEGELAFNSGSSIGGIAGTSVIQGSPLDYLERTAMDAQVSSDKILQTSNRVANKAAYPNSQLASGLKLVAKLIGGELPTRIYYVSQGGYDTHTNQLTSQDRLLRDLGDSLKAFIEDMKAQGNFERVAIMTFSEFGRRVGENASGGTDHGAASVMFAMGPKVKAGLQGKYPSIAPGDLKNGDPVYTTDFRSVYAGVLEGWLKTPSAPVLGQQFKPLVLV
ncbi:MAG: DUF1501 domain-containing protein [Verrucomicrobiota bacterium]